LLHGVQQSYYILVLLILCNETNITSQSSNLQAKEAKTVEEVTGYTVTCFDESDTELRDLRGTHTHHTHTQTH
jgi:hypothetical protein